MRTYWYVIGLLVAVLSFLGLVSGYFESTIQTWLGSGAATKERAERSGVVIARDVPVVSTSAYVVATGSFPQFDALPASYNSAIRETVETALKEHQHTSEENWKGRYATEIEQGSIPTTGEVPSADEKYQFSVESTIMRNDTSYVAVVVRVGGYTGGAHGYQHISTFTFDRQKNKMLTFADLYPTEGSRKELASYLQKSLVETIAAKGSMSESEVDRKWIAEGTNPETIENVSRFVPMSLSSISKSPNGEVVVFYFPEYQVAPYAFGEQEVVVPYRAVSAVE